MKHRPLYLFSDSSGNLLEHFFNAILTQFPKGSFSLKTFPFIKDEKTVAGLLKDLKEGIVFHGFASPKMKSAVASECAKGGLKSWDVTGPTVGFLEQASGLPASRTPKPFHRMNREYLNRMAALEFTMQHDDGRRIEDLHQAEIVLVGISRVSKSPTSLFLAYRGFRAMNVSIIPDAPLPEPLERHRRKNIVALTLQPKRLAEIRQRRFAKWELGKTDYQDVRAVIHEVMEAEKVYKKKGWPILDTTELAIEESSALILSKLNLKPKTVE